MTIVKLLPRFIALALLTCSMPALAADVNLFFCKKGLKSASEEAYVIDYDDGYIYQVEYRPAVAAVKVTRFRLLEILEHNIRGVIHEEYSGDYLKGSGQFELLPRNRLRKMVSLDKSKGVLMKLYTGGGDKFGSCSTAVIDRIDVVSTLKEQGLMIKNNVLN